MDMSGMAMSSSTSSTANMPSSASSSMSGMSMDGGVMMGMQDMMMVFFSASDTPLYSSAWTPQTSGQYVGTCIFLIALSIIFRVLIAVRCNFLSLLAWATYRRDTNILRSDSDKNPLASSNVRAERRPWRINEALLRAMLDTTLAGVSYLLMLAVMTMNVGYFLSVLGGTFLGSFVLGGLTGTAAH